ncbi:single-stranded DNA-binding protein [Actinoplanes aureus]|uniref:Single-stranded DNA-binding protein n=1 Tax=Actinoplanes aureus TaxID=2792083 RepID=A0A931G233_9ACTN|nr:single-stranded DNA-binding protein [Actinoplanes aureus]MBG0567705.1 single-stranded DNA-binding protein [Actinoplanes aureus]
MFETNIVVVGNVLTAPEWRRTNSSNSLVANFKIASTARRYDRETGRWVDGNSMRVRVSAWRRLAEGVASSITVGDPVIVYGRIYTRDWVDEEKNHRVSYEMEAFAIGHDLGRGRSRFYRNKPTPANSMIEGPDADAIVGGEPTITVGESEVPVAYGDGLPERHPEEEAPTFLEVVADLEEEPAFTEPESAPAEPEPDAPTVETRRSRRGTRREPVPA